MINCLTKLAIALPLKSKSALDISILLKPILKENRTRDFRTNQGKDFFNKHVNKLIKMYNINLYATFSDKIASIVEIFYRILKNLTWHKFTSRGI